MKRVQLKDIAIVDWGNTSLTKKAFVATGGYLGVSAAGCDGRIDHREHEVGTLVLSAIGANCGKMFLPTEPFTAIKNTITIKPLEGVDARFLFFYLNNFQIPSRGAGQPFITKGDANKAQIPLPPLETQRKIAAILDAADAHRRKTEELLAKYDELAQSIFLDMFGDPVTNPKGWEMKTVAAICKKIQGGGTPSKSNPDFYTGTIPWVTPKDMKKKRISSSQDSITEEAVRLSSAKMIPERSVLMVVRSGILKHTLPIAMNSNQVALNQDMKAFTTNNNICLPEYLMYYFTASAYSILSQVRSVTAHNLNFKDILNRSIPIPPVDLQNSFADSLGKIELSISHAEESILNSNNLFQSLLHKAFNGEIT